MCLGESRCAREGVCVSSVCRECVLVNEPVFICVSMQNMVHMCFYLACLSAHVRICVRLRGCVCVCAIVGSVRGGFGVGVVSSVHQKLKLVRLPYFLMEPPDVIAANPHHVI